jgi:Tfp pilus assembly protein PilN
MIKVNLLVGKKPLDVANLGGFDLSKLNVKYLVIAILLSYTPELFLNDMLTKELAGFNLQIETLNKEFKTYQAKLDSLKNIQKQIEALENLEKQLESKLNIVKGIFNKRSNPMNIMLYIAKNTPADLWLNEIVIEKNDITFKGESRDYKSIGVFIENLRSSIFFRKDIRLDSSATITKENGVRVEGFSVKGYIVSYE